MTQLREIPDHSDRLYAIGDIHGCRSELEVLLAALTQAEAITPRDIVLFIGDYIDRGEDSRGVIDILLQFSSKHPSCIFLKGNHEDMLLSYLGFPGRDGMAYLVNGGTQCLMSYGFKMGEGTPPTGAEVLKAIPPEHLRFLKGLEHYVITPRFVFAHAGLNPLRDLHHQVENDLLWIREEFIFNRHFFGRPVVFGHTPYEDVLFNLPYKIGIDTGCVFGNKLTCIEVRDGKLLQVGKGSSKVTTKPFPKE